MGIASEIEKGYGGFTGHYGRFYSCIICNQVLGADYRGVRQHFKKHIRNKEMKEEFANDILINFKKPTIYKND